MKTKVWGPFCVLVAVLTVGVYWARAHISRVSVLELRWTRYVGLQECVDHQPGDRFFQGMSQETIKPCRWVWVGLRMTSGYNSTPEWPGLDDLDERYREAFRSELYEAKLVPLDFPTTKWYYAGSNVLHYELFFDSMVNHTSKPRVTATFGQVEKVVK